MDLIIYKPNLKYYISNTQKFDQQKDFITTPKIKSLYNHYITHQTTQILTQFNNKSLLEFNTNNNILTTTILTKLTEHNNLPTKYLIIKVNPTLHTQQQQTLTNQIKQNPIQIH